MRGNGERIGPQNLPTSSVAGGIWNLLNQQRAQQRGAWPSATPAVTTDPYFMYVPLLLNTTSTNAQQNNTFLDSSSNAFTITRNGTPTQGAFTPYQPSGYWSGVFDGSSSQSLSLPSSSSLAVGAGDFCLEGWVYRNATGQQGLFSNAASSAGADTVLELQLYNGGSGGEKLVFNGWNTIFLTSTTVFAVGNWYHFAICRSGTTMSMFVNGTREATTTTANNFSSTNVFYIGRQSASTTAVLNGYLSNLRLVKGSSVYTPSGTTITVPTTPLTAITNTSLLTLQSNRFIDNSTNAFAITVNGTPKIQAFQPFAPAASYDAATYGGSGYFNGTTDYLSIPNNAAFELGANNFSYEAFVYATISTNTFGQGIVSYGITGNTGTSTCDLQINLNGYLQLAYATGATATLTDPALLPLNQWVHCVVCRSGTTLSMFVNGARKATTTTSATVGTGGSMTIAGQWYGSGSNRQFQNGYISSVRVLKNASAYDATQTTLTVPTTPVTAVSGTSLLTNFTNAGIYDAAWQNNALTVGDAQVSTTQYKWSPTSMKFDGTGDYLLLPDNVNLQIGSGDYTIEFWLYASSLAGSFSGIVDTRTSGGVDTNGFTIYFATSQLRFRTNGSDILTYSSFPTGTWTYVAITRSGSSANNTKLFINGTQQAQATNTTSFTQTSRFVIGTTYPLTGDYYNGYIQDLRITKGVARTITTPTAAFPTR